MPSWLNQLRVSVSEQLQPSTAAQKPTGKVVGIIKRNWRPFCGMLNVSQIKEVRVTCCTFHGVMSHAFRAQSPQMSYQPGSRCGLNVAGV